MIFATGNHSMHKHNEIDRCIKINSFPIDRVYSTKFIGIYIDSKLSWSEHIKYIRGKLFKRFGIICKARTLLHRSTLVNKWNESGFRPPLCIYRLNWAGRTSWGWCDDWDDTVLQTQDSKFEPRRSEAEHATSRSQRLPTILTFTRGWGRNIFVSFKPPRPEIEPRTLAWKAAVLTTTLGPPPTTGGNSVVWLIN